MGAGLDNQSGPSPRWVSTYLNQRHVVKIRARVPEPRPAVPEEIPGYNLTHPARERLCWWMSGRGEKFLPTADDVELRSLVELMPYIRYMSWEGDESLVIRVFGSALCEAAGMDLRGVDLFAYGEHENRARDIARLKLLPKHPCGVIAFWNITDQIDRKSTRLNSSHDQISYAVFCLKKKKKKHTRAESASRNRLGHKTQE